MAKQTAAASRGEPLPDERERARRRAWRRRLANTGVVSILCLVAPAATEAREERWRVSETTTARHRLALAASAAGRLLEVDSLGGAVTVATTAAAGEIVEATVVESRFGDGEGDLARARREVRLALREEPGAIRLIVEAPGCPAGGCHRGCFRGWRELGYEVRYDIDLAVPAGVDLLLGTVDGELRVTGARGNIRASNVNGPVELIGVAGDGSASGVNGPVTVGFAEPPRGAWSFSSINGRLEVAFPPGLAADLAFRTLNGEIWTDFPYVSLPAKPRPAGPPGAAEGEEGRFVFRSDPFTRVRIAAGGPELTFETVNGDILVRRADAGGDPRARTPSIEE